MVFGDTWLRAALVGSKVSGLVAVDSRAVVARVERINADYIHGKRLVVCM